MMSAKQEEEDLLQISLRWFHFLSVGWHQYCFAPSGSSGHEKSALARDKTTNTKIAGDRQTYFRHRKHQQLSQPQMTALISPVH